MIDPEKRKAIYCLHQEGMAARKIARELKVDRHTVRAIISAKGEVPANPRKDRMDLSSELLCELYGKCNGYVQRIHEILLEEHGIKIAYSTLTGKIREMGLGRSVKKRCDQYPDEPGAEMQHDTSPYKMIFSGKRVGVIASLLYFRYSKIRYLKFYRSFNRFKMKCFFHEALMHWGYAAPVCIIDNTNLARLHGTGKNAVIVPEMAAFAKSYGFQFICHEVNHPNRKAGDERVFFTTTTNLFPGREFKCLEDLNQQAFSWATERLKNRPTGKSRLIPAQAFLYEQGFLKRVSPHLSPPYLVHQRNIDQYGYISFDGNYYWAPGIKRHNVTLLQYPNAIQIYHNRTLLIEYPLPPWDVKNRKFFPKDRPKPGHEPAQRKHPTNEEEKILRGFSSLIDTYLTFAVKALGPKQKHRFIRRLYTLYCKISQALFEKTIERALSYRITDLETLHRIATLQMKEAHYQTPAVLLDDTFTTRPSFIEGRFTDPVDLSIYRDNEEEKDESGID